MAMLGGGVNRRPMWMTPGVGDGIEQRRNQDFGIDPSVQQAVGQYAAMPAQEPAPQRDWGQGLQDIGTGFMAAQAAIDGNFGQSAQLSQSIGADQRAQQAELAKRVAGLQDYTRRKQIDQQYQAPVNNDTAADWAFYEQKLKPEQFETWKQGRYDPIVNVPLPGGQVYAGPRSGLEAALGGGGQAPAAPVGRLTPLPGGGAGNSAGGFRTDIPSGNPLDPWRR